MFANKKGFSWSSNWTCIFNATCVTWCIKRYQTPVWEENIQLGYNEPETPECRHPYQAIYSSSCNDGSGKGCNYLVEGPIFYFHDYGSKGTIGCWISVVALRWLTSKKLSCVPRKNSLDAIGIRWLQYSSTMFYWNFLCKLCSCSFLNMFDSFVFWA